MKVFLIGLPGCGKSTLAKLVAIQLGRTFVDLDIETMKGERQSIADIFTTKGEAQFRALEKTCLTKWCTRSTDFVMATGGGTPCFLSNMDLVKKSGISIFLDADINEIAGRMMNTELAKRPLFAGHDVDTIAGRVKEMRTQRIAYYNQADVKLTGSQISVDQIIKEILTLEGKP
ncbi:MAG TPA: shikimate kinase [Cyclobacteriaceae bacterium]